MLYTWWPDRTIWDSRAFREKERTIRKRSSQRNRRYCVDRLVFETLLKTVDESVSFECGGRIHGTLTPPVDTDKKCIRSVAENLQFSSTLCVFLRKSSGWKHLIALVLLTNANPSGYVGSEATIELLQSTVRTGARKATTSGAEMNAMMGVSSAVILRHTETRSSNVRIYSIDVTYVVRRRIACTVRVYPISSHRMARQCALFWEE